MATLQDIADVVGVSKVTVSKVLRGKVKGSYPRSAAQAKRIREVAVELGYRVDWRARALKTKRTHMIGLLSTDKIATQTHDPALLTGLVQAFGESGCHLVFVRVGQVGSGVSGANFADARFDGLIIDYHIEPEELEIIQQAELPAVIINAPSPQDGVISVMPDHFKAGALAAEHLLSLGHRRVAFLDSSKSEQQSWPRHMIGQWQAGIRHTMKRAGCGEGFTNVEPDNGNELETPEHYLPLLSALMARPDRPTAIVANNANRVAQVALPMTRRLGLSCPRDVSVVAMVDENFLAWVSPSVTAVMLPYAELGREAARRLLASIEGIPQKSLAVSPALEPRLVTRASTGPCPSVTPSP